MKVDLHEDGSATLLEDVYIRWRGIEYPFEKGTRFNGASIPWLFWTMLGLHPYHPRVIRGALFHDVEYGRGFKLFADRAFRSLIKEDGCNLWQRQLVYLAVKFFGSKSVEMPKR